MSILCCQSEPYGGAIACGFSTSRSTIPLELSAAIVEAGQVRRPSARPGQRSPRTLERMTVPQQRAILNEIGETLVGGVYRRTVLRVCPDGSSTHASYVTGRATA